MGVEVNPVPPFPIPIVVAFQVPVPMVPRVVIFVEPVQVDNAVFSTLFNERSVLVVEASSNCTAPLPLDLPSTPAPVTINWSGVIFWLYIYCDSTSKLKVSIF